MTTEAKATARPWRYDAGSGFVLSADGQIIAQTWSKHGEDFGNAKPNGEFAVTAVNSFDAMRDALDDLLARYLALVNSGDAGHWNPEHDSEVRAARAALRLTEGKE